jgi:hypothetical protein
MVRGEACTDHRVPALGWRVEQVDAVAAVGAGCTCTWCSPLSTGTLRSGGAQASGGRTASASLGRSYFQYDLDPSHTKLLVHTYVTEHTRGTCAKGR